MANIEWYSEKIGLIFLIQKKIVWKQSRVILKKILALQAL